MTRDYPGTESGEQVVMLTCSAKRNERGGDTAKTYCNQPHWAFHVVLDVCRDRGPTADSLPTPRPVRLRQNGFARVVDTVQRAPHGGADDGAGSLRAIEFLVR